MQLAQLLVRLNIQRVVPITIVTATDIDQHDAADFTDAMHGPLHRVPQSKDFPRPIEGAEPVHEFLNRHRCRTRITKLCSFVCDGVSFVVILQAML